MSRYPGTQFIMVDNTNAAASIPVATVNPSAPVYISTFHSVKGPEEIMTVAGNEFYDYYGSQANVLFSKYGQPLLQASMNINAGARLIAKRAVLDDAKLANATLGVTLTKTLKADPVLTLDANGHITAVTIGNYSEDSDVNDTKMVLRPIVISIDDTTAADEVVVEGKELYNLHRSNIITNILGGSNTEGFAINTGATVTGNYPEGSALAGQKKTFRLVSEGGKMKNGFASRFIEWTMGTPDSTTNFTYDDATRTYTITDADTASDETDAEILAAISASTSVEYVFPLFTIFDNGRGVSTKSISFAYDAATSKTIGKAAYIMKVIDYSTNTTLESVSFSIDPVTRNTNTGYTFDIESAVNFTSRQIKAKMHYDSYEKLLEVLADQAGTDDTVFISTDCIFGHTTKGTVLEGGLVTSRLFVDSASTAKNIDILTKSDTTAYYYYNYTERYKRGYSEKLLFGFDGSITETNGEDVETFEASAITMTAADEYLKVYALEDETDFTTVDINTNTDDETISENNVKMYNNQKYYKIVSGTSTTDKNSNTETVKYDIKGDKTVIAKYARMVGTTEIDDGAGGTIAVAVYNVITVETTYTWDGLYQDQYRKFFSGEFDRDIYNLDIHFPNCLFDANYDKKVKLAAQKLSAYRGDFLAYMDMGIDKVKSYSQAMELLPGESEVYAELSEDSKYYYIRDMHNAVTCISYDIRDPYTNKQISVTGTYGLSIAMVNHFMTGVGKVFAGKANGIVINNAIESTVNYIPKIYPSSAMTSLANIGNTYPSDDETIINEKQIMNDARINYGSYYDGVFVMDTEYTLVPNESEYAFINNVMLVNQLIQAIRKACPAARYSFITSDDLETYRKAVMTVVNSMRSNFANVTFEYIQDENSVNNKIFYAALKVVFRPFAQAEIFTITALNYSTLES